MFKRLHIYRGQLWCIFFQHPFNLLLITVSIFLLMGPLPAVGSGTSWGINSTCNPGEERTPKSKLINILLPLANMIDSGRVLDLNLEVYSSWSYWQLLGNRCSTEEPEIKKVRKRKTKFWSCNWILDHDAPRRALGLVSNTSPEVPFRFRLCGSQCLSFATKIILT